MLALGAIGHVVRNEWHCLNTYVVYTTPEDDPHGRVLHPCCESWGYVEGCLNGACSVGRENHRQMRSQAAHS